MKSNLIIIAFILLCSSAFGQMGNNTISLLFAEAHTITATKGTFPTTESGNNPFIITSGPHFGLSYNRRIHKGLSLEANYIFVSEKAQYTYSQGTDTHYVSNGSVNMLWLQVLCKYTFYKYFFIDGGFSADVQTNYQDAMQMYEQSGVGLEAGFGAKITTGHITFFVNPYLHRHSIIIIKSSSETYWNHKLDETGIKLGIGYNF